jgi:hypothetical protein
LPERGALCIRQITPFLAVADNDGEFATWSLGPEIVAGSLCLQQGAIRGNFIFCGTDRLALRIIEDDVCFNEISVLRQGLNVGGIGFYLLTRQKFR